MKFGCFDVNEDVLGDIIKVNREAFIRNNMLRAYGPSTCGRLRRWLLRLKPEHYRQAGDDMGMKYKWCLGKMVVMDVVFFMPSHPNCRCVVVPEEGGE